MWCPKAGARLQSEECAPRVEHGRAAGPGKSFTDPDRRCARTNQRELPRRNRPYITGLAPDHPHELPPTLSARRRQRRGERAVARDASDPGPTTCAFAPSAVAWRHGAVTAAPQAAIACPFHEAASAPVAPPCEASS